MAGPLAGVRNLNCTPVVLGPWAAQQLGDGGERGNAGWQCRLIEHGRH